LVLLLLVGLLSLTLQPLGFLCLSFSDPALEALVGLGAHHRNFPER